MKTNDRPTCFVCKQPSCKRHEASDRHFNAVMNGTPDEIDAATSHLDEVFELCEARIKPS